MENDLRTLKQKAWGEVERLKPRLAEICLAIHAHPELGGEEFFALDLLSRELAAAGFAVERGYFGIPTAFHAVRAGRAARPAVAFLAEYDALPGLGHACGHNIIGTAALGAALALAPLLAALPGGIHVFGTPAEETNGAKVPLAAGGAFRDIDAAMMIHPSGRTVLTAPSLAMDALEFRFRGRAAHAASAPHEGINALDAVILTFNAVNALRQHVRPDVRIHGIITRGGEAPNIVPEEAVARFYVRAARRQYLDEVTGRVVNCARAGALATGAELTVNNFEYSFDEMRNNTALAGAMQANLTALGEEVVPCGEGLGSLDMGNVSHVVPAVHPYISIGTATLVSHTREFAAAAGSEGGLRAMVLGAKALAATALDVLLDAELRQAVRAEFAAADSQ
jgi:amidohydrolase